MEATESVLRAGYWLDRYELLCPIASGGMATVWLARLRGKRGFEKLFAIKTIRTELVDDARFQEMFLDEARIASGIQHPNVAQILDLGEQDDVLFIVMEWVDGDSLSRIRRLMAKRDSRLPVGVVLRVLADACSGLHAAHELRDESGESLEIVHRDVSPHNILLSSSGAAKVIDFGIAKAQNRRQNETRTGIVKGKVHYMAPEQVKKGGLVDRRADVWALGVCLYELVMGRLPYEGEDDVGVIRRLMSDDPPVTSDAPPVIARVLERAVVLDPDARFPTAAGMQRAIEGAMKEMGESKSVEDVAAFVRSELPELARGRRNAVGKAVEEARERGTPATGARDEAAFAPTLVGERGAGAKEREEMGTVPLIRRKAGSLAVAQSSGDSRAAPSAMLEEEPITIPKRSRAWLWGAVLLASAGVAGGLLWPSATNRVLIVLGWETIVAPPRTEDTVSRARVAPAPSGPEDRPTAPPNATRPPPSETTVTPATNAVASQQQHEPPRHVPVPTATAIEANAPAAVERALPALTPLPAASEDDPNNPYND